MSDASPQPGRFMLFVVGDEPNSRNARANLARIIKFNGLDPDEVVVIDVLMNFQEAIKHKIFITPALIVQGPSSTITIYGDLSNEDKVLAALRTPAIL